MGKEAQFARAKVAPVVAGDRRWDFTDVERPLYKEIRGGLGERFLPSDRCAAIGLDLMNRLHHDARQIKGKI